MGTRIWVVAAASAVLGGAVWGCSGGETLAPGGGTGAAGAGGSGGLGTGGAALSGGLGGVGGSMASGGSAAGGSGGALPAGPPRAALDAVAGRCAGATYRLDVEIGRVPAQRVASGATYAVAGAAPIKP